MPRLLLVSLQRMKRNLPTCWSISAGLGFPCPKKKLGRLAWEYANMNGITGFSARKEKAGHKWLKGFLRCYPQLKSKKAKNISVNRAMCANPITIGGFFTQYHQVCEKFNIISPMYIWNCDESGVQDVPKEEEVIGVAGEKAQCQGPSDRGETSTFLTFANACGQVMPPLIIHKGKKVNETWTYGTSPDVMVHASVKG